MGSKSRYALSVRLTDPDFMARPDSSELNQVSYSAVFRDYQDALNRRRGLRQSIGRQLDESGGVTPDIGQIADDALKLLDFHIAFNSLVLTSLAQEGGEIQRIQEGSGGSG